MNVIYVLCPVLEAKQRAPCSLQYPGGSPGA